MSNISDRKAESFVEFSGASQTPALQVVGSWTLSNFENCQEDLNRIFLKIGEQKFDYISIDGARLQKIDTTGAHLLCQFLSQITNSVESLPEHQREVPKVFLENYSPESHNMFEMVRERETKFFASQKKEKTEPLSMLGRVGKVGVSFYQYLRDILSFQGQVTESIIQIILKPAYFRIKEVVTQLEEACIKSLPVVSLVTFLIGIVVAYLMAIQVEKYGGSIFVVNGVALAMCRELSPIIVAVVMAGRSGSAYTAQIGAMRLNEEVDAITVLGLSPMHVLVVPRLIALVLSMPLLVFIGDLVGIAGGMLICQQYLSISFTTFIDRLQTALPIKHFIVGMIKAPVFAAVIALIGCRRGLTTEMNARSVGLSTTATVVESIVLVILINAAFAVIFSDIGI